MMSSSFPFHISQPFAALLLFFSHVPASLFFYTLSLHDALPIYFCYDIDSLNGDKKEGSYQMTQEKVLIMAVNLPRSEEHTSELQSRGHLVCRLLLEKKKFVALLYSSIFLYRTIV